MESIQCTFHMLFTRCKVCCPQQQGHIFKAIHCETSEEIWQVKGEVVGATWKPHGLFYSPEHQTLFVCDDGQLVVLDPRDGSLLQVILLPKLKRLISLYFLKGKIIVHNKKKNCREINVFTFE